MPRNKTDKSDYQKVSITLPPDLYADVSRLARYKGNNFNAFVRDIIADFVQNKSPILQRLKQLDEEIANLER